MKQETIRTAVIGILIGSVLTLLFAPAVGGMLGGRSAMMRPDAEGMNSAQGGGIDAHFIEQMIPHHEDAILMAELALTKAKRPEVQQLARDIKMAQNKEIQEMRAWYADWFGKEVPDVFATMGHGSRSGMLHMGMRGDSADLRALQDASDFDKAFIEEMIPHHQMAVMMAEMLAAATERAEMKKLAADIITAQTKEIDDMRAWYRAW